MLQIMLLVIVAFLAGAVAPNRRDVKHPTAELNKGSALDGDIQFRKVPHDPIDEALDIVLPDELGDGLDLEKLAVLVGDQSVLGEVVGEDLGDSIPELLFLLGQIGSSDDSNGYFFGEGFHEGHHFGGYLSPGDGEGSVYVEEGDDARVGRGGHFDFFGFRFRNSGNSSH